MLEIVDFDNPVSNDRAVCHSGDNVSVDASGKSEQIFIDTRRLHHRVHAIALTANVFSTFFDVKLSNVDIKVKHLQFIESSGPNESSKTAWYTRTLIAVNPLFRASLREEVAGAQAKARRRTTDFNVHGGPLGMLVNTTYLRTRELAFEDTNRFGQVRAVRQRMIDEHTPIDPKANFVVLFALSRAALLAPTAVISDDALGTDVPKKDVSWDIEAILSQALARTRHEVIQKTQQSLGMLFPWLKEEKRRIFDSVPAVCAALSSHALPDLKPRFLSDKNKEGLDVSAFVDILFHQLVAQFPGLMKHKEAATLVALLHELFNQVDINGDKRVDWDEFTSHTINSGMRAAIAPRSGGGNHAQVLPDEFTVHYELDLAYSLQSTSKPSSSNGNGQNFGSIVTAAAVPIQQKRIEAGRMEAPGGKPMLQPRQISFMRYVEELRRIFVVEVNSPAFKAYDSFGRFQHDYDFQVHEEAAASRLQSQNEAKAVGGDALFIQIKTGDETSSRCEARDSSRTKEKYPSSRKIDGTSSSYGGADTSVAFKVIHDLIYITDREMLAAALSDHAIHLLVEQLSSAGKHRTYKKAGTIVTYSLHRKLIWSSAAERLFSIDTYSKLYSWCLDSGMKSQKYASHAFTPHTDIAMDCILIKDKGLLATCSLDRKIHLWGIENLRLRGTLTGHKLGVRCLAYAQCALVSAGFDNDVFVWNVQSRECVTRLSGHQAAICAIEVAAPSMDAATVVTLDDDAECRMWKISTSSCACVQRFRLPFLDPSAPTRALVLPWNVDRTVDDFSDIFFGGCRMYHMIPVKTFREFQPPSAVVFNELSLSFIGSVSDNIHIWDARTGHYSQRFTVAPSQVGVSPRTSCPTIGGGNQTLSTRCEISTFCIDYPRQRRLFVGTEQGEILTVNYATGIVMSKCEAHTPEEVSALTFCDLTKCVVSCGTDRRLIIWKDVKGELTLLRTVANAHASNFTCFCYSPRLSIIVSGSSEGFLVVWDFQMLQQHAALALQQGEHATACKVIDPYPLLLAGDASGHILIWHLEFQETGFVKAHPLCSLSLPSCGLHDSTGVLRVAPKVNPELSTSDSDAKSTFYSSSSLSSSTAITTLSALQYERRSSRSSFYRSQPGEGSSQEDDNGDCGASKYRGQDKSDTNGCITLFAGTDSGHLLSWNLASILWIDDHHRVIPLQDEHCPPWFSSFKPYRKLDRDMLRCDPCKTQIDEAAFQRLENFPPQAQRHVHDDSVLHLLVVNDPPCVYTCAADGFQRLWVPNDLSPYGEFPLPNADASVSRSGGQKRTIPPSNWTYFHGTPLEVSPEHDAAASKLISAVEKAKAKNGRNRFRKAVSRIMTVRAFGMKLEKEQFDEEKVKAEWERRLHSMSPGTKANVEARALKRASMGVRQGVQSSVDDSPHEVANLACSFTENDKSSVAANTEQDCTRQNALRQIGKNAPEKSSDSEKGMFKQTAHPNVAKNYKSLATRGSEATQNKFMPCLTVEARTRDISQKMPLAPAFSMQSINRGLQLGVYDIESCEKLRGIAKYSERRLAYNRLAQLSTESLPELDALERQQSVEEVQTFDSKRAVDDSRNQLPSVRIKKCGKDVLPLLDPPIMPEGPGWQHASKRHDFKFNGDVQRHVDKMQAAMKSQAHKAKFARSVVGIQMRPPHRRESSADMSLDELVRPYYTAHDIIEFRNSFNYVDVDLSGSINMEEWFIFMARMNQSLTRIESQLLFIHIDTDEDGLINMRELIAIVFQRCTPDQQRSIFLKLQEQIRFEAEMRKKRALQIGMQIKELDIFNGGTAH